MSVEHYKLSLLRDVEDDTWLCHLPHGVTPADTFTGVVWEVALRDHGAKRGILYRFAIAA